MIAIEGNFAYSFVLGVLAAVNPCGFVLLPTYLLFFLGTREEPNLGTSERLGRALKVSAGVSIGFLGVFFVIGVISRLFTQWIELNAKYAALAIGVVLVVGGVRMLTGWTPKFATPEIGGTSEKTFRATVVYGVAYAVASIGCTIGFLTTAIFGSIAINGFVSGVISILLYGIGMAMLVTALTVSLAFAKTGIVTVIKNRLGVIQRLAALLVTLTGLYLVLYWYAAISETRSTAIVSRIERWQTKVASFLQEQGAPRLVLVMTAIVALAVLVSRAGKREKVGS
ncbi:MAG: cytochrome c biogenesis CcdA family protein [Actinomycetota bacterium]